MRDALVQIVLRLRDDILKDRDGGHNPSSGHDSMYDAGGSGHHIPSVLPGVSSVASLGYEHRGETGSGLGLLSSSYGYGSLPVCHICTQLHTIRVLFCIIMLNCFLLQMGDSGYGSLSSYSSKQLYGG